MVVESRTSRSLARLGEYELVRRIATGGMAEVYEARRPGPRGFAKRVALKRILPQLAMDQRLVRMFCAEARVHAALTHPNLVSVLDFGEAAGELYLVMEYVDGVPLSEVLRAVAARKRAIELGPALHIAREVAAGLAYAHQYRDDDDAPLGVVHRDVAPNNILLGRAGEVKLTDFGIVHSTWSDVRTAPGELRGKAGYVSPEQAMGRAVEARSDLFSLGVVLAEMLLGVPLIPGHGELEVLKNLQSRSWANLAPLAGKVPLGAIELLQRLLAKSPRNRPSAAQLVDELDRLATQQGVRTSAHTLSLWLADLGIVRIESNVRVRPSRDDSPYRAPAPAEGRAEQPTIVGDDALKPIVVALPTPDLADEGPTRQRPLPSGAPNLRYRLRRPGGQIIGPLSLGSVLAMLATARAGLDSELAREDGPFLKLSRAFELTRLASRPLYRFFDPIALLATERQPVERSTLPAHLLRLSALRRTGLLVHRQGAEQRRIYFEDGVPKATASTDPSELLGAQLVRTNVVSPADMERVLESGYRSGCPLGESLVRAGLLSNEHLARAIAEQRIGRLTALCRARGGELFFVEAAQSGEQVLGLSQRPLGALIDALRAAYPEGELLSLLVGLERTALSPSTSCAELRGSLCLSSDEAYAFDLCLRGIKIGLVLREAKARGEGALRAAAFAIFAGLSVGAFVARTD
jgi:eukaryotic-like serine/threonine-protein kinase